MTALRNPSVATTALWSFGTAVVGAALGYGLGTWACKWGSVGWGGAAPSDAVSVKFSGSSCSFAVGDVFACSEIPTRLASIPRQTRIVLFASQGSQGIVQSTIGALQRAGFTNIEVREDG